jgi:hypothetical protein
MKFMLALVVVLSVYCVPAFAEMTSPDASEWKVYNNKYYGFKLKYPASLVGRNKFNSAYFLGAGWSMQGSDHTNNSLQHSVWEIQLQNSRGRGKDGGEYYYQSYVRIGVSSFLPDVAACDKTNRASPFSDAGMSQYVSGTSYRQLHKGKCYSVEYVETGSNSANIPNFSQMTMKNQALAKKIIRTFQFLEM